MKLLLLLNIILGIGVLSAHTETGKASYYSTRCNGGNKTASGQKLVDSSNTAAHKTLPFGTLVKVTNLKNGKSEVVSINNKGPFIRGRIIDVTIGVAKKLGFVDAGVVPVKIEVVGKVKLK
jgi:rare lipoprotein A